VPPVPRRLDLDEDANATVHDRRTPIVAMSAFFDRPKIHADEPPAHAAIDPIASAPRRGESFHSVPVFPEEPVTHVVESNLHKIEGGFMADSLAPNRRSESGYRAILDLTTDPVDSFRPQGLALPSFRRKVFSRLLFITVIVTVLLIAASALSVATRRPWLDPRPPLRKAYDVAAHELRALLKI